MEEYKLPALPYDYSALEPFIDEQTMRIHHTRHHQAYVDKLNAALKNDPASQKKSLEALLAGINDVPEAIRTAVRNHGGGHHNHSLFWQMLKNDKQSPQGEVAEALNQKFGGFDKFKEQFANAAAGVFGSGWCWLVLNNGGLEIITTPNQDSPLMQGKAPILGLDVWEHAYYLKYQSARPEYIKNWWNVVNWEQVGKNYKAGSKVKM